MLPGNLLEAFPPLLASFSINWTCLQDKIFKVQRLDDFYIRTGQVQLLQVVDGAIPGRNFITEITKPFFSSFPKYTDSRFS